MADGTDPKPLRVPSADELRDPVARDRYIAEVIAAVQIGTIDPKRAAILLKAAKEIRDNTRLADFVGLVQRGQTLLKQLLALKGNITVEQVDEMCKRWLQAARWANLWPSAPVETPACDMPPLDLTLMSKSFGARWAGNRTGTRFSSLSVLWVLD